MTLLLWALSAWADSPLTTVELHQAYADDPLVQRALERGTLDAKLTRALLKGDDDLGTKAAIVSALGWSMDGRDETTALLDAAARRHRKPAARLLAEPELLDPAEAFVLGYRLALDGYFDPQAAIPLLERARAGLPRSRTVALVTAITQAQLLMDHDWCGVWRVTEAALADPILERDLAEQAEAEAIAYLSLYQPACEPGIEEETPLATPPLEPQD